MNYKYVISFLGREQQKDWARPVSDWIIVNDFTGRWSDQFCSLKEIPPSFAVRFSGSAFVSGNERDMIISMREHHCFPSPSARTYYFPKMDLVFTITQQDIDKFGEGGIIETLEYIATNQPAHGKQISTDMKSIV